MTETCMFSGLFTKYIYSDVHATVEAKICWKNTKAVLGGNTVQMTVP